MFLYFAVSLAMRFRSQNETEREINELKLNHEKACRNIIVYNEAFYKARMRSITLEREIIEIQREKEEIESKVKAYFDQMRDSKARIAAQERNREILKLSDKKIEKIKVDDECFRLRYKIDAENAKVMRIERKINDALNGVISI